MLRRARVGIVMSGVLAGTVPEATRPRPAVCVGGQLDSGGRRAGGQRAGSPFVSTIRIELIAEREPVSIVRSQASRPSHTSAVESSSGFGRRVFVAEDAAVVVMSPWHKACEVQGPSSR